MGGQPDGLLCLPNAHTGKGIRAVGLLCSPNARPEKGLVQARSWRPISPHARRGNEQAWKEHSRRCSLGQSARLGVREVRAGKNVRAAGSNLAHLEEGRTSKLGGFIERTFKHRVLPSPRGDRSDTRCTPRKPQPKSYPPHWNDRQASLAGSITSAQMEAT